MKFEAFAHSVRDILSQRWVRTVNTYERENAKRAYFETMLPRHLEIIFEINRRLLDEVRSRFPGDEGRTVRTSLIEDGTQLEQKDREYHSGGGGILPFLKKT